jgi:hypothetical protein
MIDAMKTVSDLDREYTEYLETGEGDPGEIIGQLFKLARNLESKLPVERSGWIVINASSPTKRFVHGPYESEAAARTQFDAYSITTIEITWPEKPI